MASRPQARGDSLLRFLLPLAPSAMAGVVFQADPELSFVAGLARWVSEPSQPAAPTEAPAEAPAESADAEPQAPPCSALESECVALEAEGAFVKLSDKLLAGLQERFSEASEQEVQSAYAIYLQLLVQWELLAAKVQSLADELTAKTDERPQLRRSLLVSLYALVQQFGLVELRFLVLVRLIKFAAATAQLDAVFGSSETRVASVERWAREWELSEEQKKELWGLFFDAHSADAAAVYGYALKYLELYDESADISAQPLNGRLVQSALLTICSPSLVSRRPANELTPKHSNQEDALASRRTAQHARLSPPSLSHAHDPGPKLLACSSSATNSPSSAS